MKACIAPPALTIEDVLLRVPGVIRAEVSAGSHRARIVWSEATVKPSDWMRVVQDAGYQVLPANDAFARERRMAESRKALWRLLVAGLCMMQVMMYAWPAYVAEPGDLSGEIEQLLRWASWVLTLPVIFFSCGPFFSSALRDILNRRVSMDLPVALGMLITFVVSSAGTFEPQGLFGREVYFDSLTMFVFFLLGGRWLELRLRNRTAGALEALMNRFVDADRKLTAPAHGFQKLFNLPGMQTSLAITALLMGLAGGSHCVAMCGAACAGLRQAAGTRKNEAMWGFQFGRAMGYSGLGAVAGMSMQGFGWLSV